MQRIATKVGWLTALMFTTAIAPAAQVLQDSIKYSGVGCVQYNTSPSSGSIFYYHGWSGNSHTTNNIDVRCPLEIINNDTLYPDGQLTVHVYDAHNTESVTCQLRAYGATDTSGSYMFDSDSSSAIITGYEGLSLSLDPGSPSYPDLRYYINCNLPENVTNKSFVMGYWFNPT